MQTLQAEVEPMVEVNIPQHRFTELVEQERYKRYLEERADYDARIVEMLRQDERVRDRNPTVQKAYQKYLMLLEMAR
jgi:ribonucleotide reductase beta subunit family protein with ferritin-like domain